MSNQHPPPSAPKNQSIPAPADKPANVEEDQLDEALEETFPSSDPIAVNITKEIPPKR